MRTSILPAILLLAACGDADEITVLGTLAEGAEATEVWVAGATERAAVAADSFRLTGVRGDSVDLHFAREDGRPALMRIAGLPAGELRLDRVWIEGGRAFPTGVSLPDGAVVVVNGLRMAAAEALPARLDAAGSVLAVGDDALLVRPADPRLPDLRVVVTPGTLVRSPDGEPADAGELEFGDSVRVVGAGEGGYLVAAEIVIPRERAASQEDDEGSSLAAGDRVSERDRPAPTGSREAVRREEPDREREKEWRKAQEKARERAKERRKEREKGKGKGNGKG